MPNRYSTPTPAGTNPDPEHFRTSPEQLQARLADPATRAALRAQGLTDTEIQALPQIYGLWIKGVGLEKNWLDRHPLVAKLLMAGAAGAPLAALAAPAMLGSGGAGAGGGATAALGPSTATSMADTAAIAGGATVPGSLAALTPAELAATGGAAGGAAGTAAALGPSTPASMAETANVVEGGTVPASLSTGLGPVAKKSALSTVGNWLTGGLGSTVVGTAGQLIGAGIQSSGIAHAADVEAAVQREALQYEKQRDQYLQQLEAQRYGELGQRLQPYISTGQNASARMAQILGLPDASPYTPSTPIPTAPSTPPGTYQTRPGLDTTQPPVGQAVPRPGAGAAQNPIPSRLITMQAPDGTTKQVPQDQAQWYVSRGAQIVSG